MDDHLRSWTWSHPSDDRYCDALPMEHDAANTSEPYVDSLRQLNKIVERILPERSPLSFVSVRPKDMPVTLKRSFVDHKDCTRELINRKPSSVSSIVTEIPIDSPVKHPPLSTMPGVCLEDSLRLKALRPSDSLNDSAYETYCGDASNDAIDNADKTARADELSSGNDQADYCVSPSGRKSEDDPEGLCYSKEQEAAGDRLVSSSFSGDSDCERTRGKLLENAGIEVTDGGEQDKRDKLSEVFPTESESKQSSLWVTERMLSDKLQNSSYRVNAFRSSDSSATDNLPELRRCIADDKCGAGNNLSVHVSMSLHATKLGSTPSSSSSVTPGSSMLESDRPSGRRMGNVREGSNTGGEEMKSFNCPHCAYSASKKGQVRKHLSVHGIFLCAHCEFACAQASLLEEHRRVRHPGLCGRRLCKKCRVLFQSSELEVHELHCSGEKQKWACHTCGKEFKFLSVMKAHAHKWHPAVDDGISTKPSDTASDTASSKPCSVSSGTPSMTLNPTQPDTVVGKEIKQFQCTECGKMFKTKWTLSNHTMSHAGGDTPFCCDVDGCNGVTFRSDKDLNCHRMAVHRLGPTKYECSHPGCTMQFAKYGHFKRHQLTHTASAESELLPTSASERRFVCDWMQCGKAFSHPDNLRVHYRRHTDEKPHHCHHCEAAYRQKSGLKYHLEKVHGEKTVGRCGRKRKLAMEHDSILKYGSSNQMPSNGALLSCRPSSRSEELRSHAENRSGQAVLSDRETVDSSMFNVKHMALSKVREVNINMTDLQTKRWSKSDTDSTAKGRRWSLPESLSQDCDDNLENIDINDEWLLDEEDGFISKPRKASEAGVTGNAAEGDHDLAGSTSDTEPLDEDFCEELRKLSDAINTEVLSPRELDGISSPFGSPVGTAYGASKSDSIGNILPDMSSSHPGLYQGISSHEKKTGVFDCFSPKPLPCDSNASSEFYPRHPEVAVTAVSTSSMLTHAQYNAVTSDQPEMVNGYLPDGYSCPDVRPAHFDRNTSTSESTPLPVDAPEIAETVSYPSAPFESSLHPWSAAINSSRWNSPSNENPAFMPPLGISSISACSSTETGFGSQICRDDSTYSNLMSTWSPAENTQQWLGPDGIIHPNWSQRHLAIMRGQTDVPQRHEWHMGRQGESAFSRSGTAFDDHIGFEVGHQTSPKPPYRADMAEVPSISEHFIDSFAGGVYPISGVSHRRSWSDLYGRSSHMTGIGNYEYNLPRNVYRSAVQSDRCYLTSGYSGIQSHASYEHGVEAEGLHGITNNAYRIAPMHSPHWPMPGLSDARESLRPVPGAQHSSVLYNVVPRYY